MRSFALEHAPDPTAAMLLADSPAASYIAGGTNLLDLMKLNVVHPDRLIDISQLRHVYGSITADADGLHLGALTRMSDAAEEPFIRRNYPVLAQALAQAASAQLRNMASLAGTVLQRTRCNYFRDPTWAACNKRIPGSGCAAIAGVNRRLAVLGVSEHCIANYPGDFAIALVALDAEAILHSSSGTTRTVRVEDLHRLPGDTPHTETTLAPGELISGFRVPAGPWTRQSRYVKVRDRTSFDFALASAAVGLHLHPDGTVAAIRVGIGGLVAKPWRAHEAEAALMGRPLDEAAAQEAAEAAFANAVTHGENGFKPELGRRTLVRALLEAAALEA